VTVLRVAAAVLVAVAAGCSQDDDGARRTALTVAGYVAPWDQRSRPALDRPPAPVGELSPVWYQPTDSGEVRVVDGARGRAGSAATARGEEPVALVPSVSNFREGRWDGELVAAILDDRERRRAHIEALVEVASAPHVAGIDLDYEALDGADREAYSAFVRDLAEALHDADRTLSVTVHAKTREPGHWPGAEAQDWRALGDAADSVRIMAYDHAWEGSPPGPVAPLPWVDDVLRFAVDQIPPEKISLGLPTYGYDWPDGGPGADVAWADATALVESAGADERWDDESASPWLTYTDDTGTSHTVWYEDARSLEAKVDLARQYELGGVFVWKIGGEDPAIWEVLQDDA
jgi:spore germination protein